MVESYHKTIENQNILKLRESLRDLPLFLGEFFRGIADQTSVKTRIGYAYDLKVFFNYMAEEIQHKDIRSFTIEDIAKLKATDISDFMEYLSYYIKQVEEKPDIAIQNHSQGKSRKLAAVRTMFKYFYGKEKLAANPAELVSFPKISNKSITTLEVDEIAKLLDLTESGEKLTAKQQQYHQQTKLRDLAIMTSILGTGMRVSECIGLDIKDINFEVGAMKVVRKGGDEAILYFGYEVAEALEAYLEVREGLEAKEGHEDALFLSIQNRRITARAVQLLVKKYSSLLTSIKKISPHKLRSTFGTQLYEETQDIYLVASVLGHADVNTTRKHYAKMDEMHRRKAANAVKLRKS